LTINFASDEKLKDSVEALITATHIDLSTSAHVVVARDTRWVWTDFCLWYDTNRI